MQEVAAELQKRHPPLLLYDRRRKLEWAQRLQARLAAVCARGRVGLPCLAPLPGAELAQGRAGRAGVLPPCLLVKSNHAT